jgi:hypothetical protein
MARTSFRKVPRAGASGMQGRQLPGVQYAGELNVRYFLILLFINAYIFNARKFCCPWLVLGIRFWNKSVHTHYSEGLKPHLDSDTLANTQE